jgi:hypothetical protein
VATVGQVERRKSAPSCPDRIVALSILLAKMTSTLELLTIVLVSRHGGWKGRGGREAMAFPSRTNTIQRG